MKVSRIPSAHMQRPMVDLHTVHDTLSYMHDDMARVPGLEHVAVALERAMKEVSQARLGSSASTHGDDERCSDSAPKLAARFLPRRRREA